MSDPITIIGISSLSAILSLIVMGSLARNQLPGTVEWCWANALAALGMILTIQQGVLPAVLTVILANACTGGATALQLIGMRRFFRCYTPISVVVTGWLVMVFCIGYFRFGRDDFAARVIVFSLYHGALHIFTTMTMLRHRPPNRPKYAYYYMLGICATAMLLNLIRGGVYAAGFVPDTAPMVPTPIHVFFLAIGTLGGPALTIGMVMMAHDRMSAALERHANIDFLTDLPGRRAFVEMAEKECQRAARFGRPLAIAILDLDFFKQINDRLGHAVGDNVLTHYAQLLSSSTRANDICGRIGGEEFALLLPETDVFAATDVVDRLRTTLLGAPCWIGARSIPFTFSAGIATFRPGDNLEMLMARADNALYAAKAEGRNRTVAHPHDRAQEILAANDGIGELAVGG
ncbi:GGDEF domain-containing protein [Robbsia andropogonis]|uniref:GGDEF domain-containing protein n=1 Tax=Robbsia andropogonis TaxID=28092 RepID=UPI0004644F8E|nr:GGDEF domain-containing protein [Robbsia andropogonis]